MKLSSILVVVLGELGAGTALFVCMQQTGEIRKSFFTFQSRLVSTCFLLMAIVSMGSHFFASVYFPAALFAALAGNNFSAERPGWGKGMLLAAALLGASFLVCQSWLAATAIPARVFAVINLVAGTLLFGWVHGTMVLGHWYLIMRGLSYSHFQRAIAQLLVTVAIRSVGLVVVWIWIFYGQMAWTHNPLPPTADVLFLSMRIVWGLVLPAIFGFMAWRCALTGSNQAGTGLLYIAEVSVLIGEILAGFLGL